MSRHAALPANVLTLPKPAVTLEVVENRQTVRRHGIFFALLGKHRRSVFSQLDGSIIAADECTCVIEWHVDEWEYSSGFSVRRRLDCPVDEHSIAARAIEVMR